jgi:hypothetical protein
VIPRAIAAGVVLLGLGRALAQTPTDAAAAVALTAEQEKSMAGQARSVTRGAIDKVFGAGQAAPAAPAAAPGPMVEASLPPDRGIPSDPPPPPNGVAPADANRPAEAGPPVAAAVLERGRDPFRPFTLNLRPETNENEVLTPLQRYEIPQLRLAGVVLDLSPPRAMLQDNSGMGYIITPGTPIGRRRGVVKAIESRRVVVEEHIIDYYGREQTHQVVIEMAKDDKPQSAGQE